MVKFRGRTAIRSSERRRADPKNSRDPGCLYLKLALSRSGQSPAAQSNRKRPVCPRFSCPRFPPVVKLGVLHPPCALSLLGLRPLLVPNCPHVLPQEQTFSRTLFRECPKTSSLLLEVDDFYKGVSADPCPDALCLIRPMGASRKILVP